MVLGRSVSLDMALRMVFRVLLFDGKLSVSAAKHILTEILTQVNDALRMIRLCGPDGTDTGACLQCIDMV